MADFWLSFLAGIASGIVLTVLTAFIRGLLRRRSRGEPVKWDTKGFRALVALGIGFALIFIDVLMIDDGGFLMGIGGVILIWSALAFLP